MTRSRRRITVVLFVVCLIPYLALSYGGIRSPDSEIVFRVAESLASGRGFQVSDELTWRSFGVAEGRDGRRYAVFGPAESVVAAPTVAVARSVNATGWYEHAPFPIPISHYVGDDLMTFIRGERPSDLDPHALRFLVSFLNAVLSALSVVVFWLSVERLTRDRDAAVASAALLGLASLTWPYAGTFFSEPLATLLTLVAFWLVLGARDAGAGGPRFPRAGSFLAGLALGGATLTHLTALLFAPFLAWPLLRRGRPAGVGRARPGPAGGFALGLAVGLAALAAFNLARFGSLVETGRSVSPDAAAGLGYGTFVAPWEGIGGLIWSAGKGLLLYCPIVITGLVAWPAFHRRHPDLSLALAAAAITRLLFIASRSDWHGGFSLGPRYLVMLVPFLLVPTAVWLGSGSSGARGRRFAVAGGAGILCLIQQAYFVTGEIFSYFHLVKWSRPDAPGTAMYFDWSETPLLHLLERKRGPFLLQNVDLPVEVLWIAIAALVIALVAIGFTLVRRRPGEVVT